MNNGWILVDSVDKREAAQRDILGARYIGLDTEYDSFRYFREKLCLIQISTESHVYIFDPLLEIDFSFLGEASENPAIVKIIHACDNDIRLLNRDYGFSFTNIFDTYRAACILEDTGLSLKSIILDYLGVELKKTKKIQRSRWDLRPLTDEQLDYAALDTRHLIDLYSRLRERLTRNNLEEAAEEIFDKMAAVRWHEKTFNPKGFFTIDGYDDLEECQKLRLKKLYRWRFETAKRTNTAPFLVLSDRTIVNLSKEEADTVQSLGEAGRLSDKKVKTFGSEIIKMLGEVTKMAW
ncbi:MAG: ribonuclease D [Deltaproteobacteria bacterium]|nr:ribonuclease D [Deltaproteobacteria bacterium]